jgi:ADP-ribose pyrophosphatase
MQEKIISTQTLYDGRIVKLDLHEVELPNGQHSKREIVRHPGAVAVVAFDPEGKVLLVRQYRTAAGKVLLEIPAGTLNPDEPPLDCAVRELQEETGYKPGKVESLGGIYTAPGYTTEFIHLFLATDLSESRLQADDDEFIEVVRLPLSEALGLIEQGEIVDAKTTSGLLLASRKMGAS